MVLLADDSEHNVELDIFEGPLDLLLYLIRRDELDVYDIPVERITNSYMTYLGAMQLLDLNIAGDYLVMAATLMLIKSRMLLPKEERPVDDEADEEDPRWDLVRQLVEYKKFKDASQKLADLHDRQENVFASGTRKPLSLAPVGDPSRSVDVGLFDLIAALAGVLQRIDEAKPGEVYAERFTVAEKFDVICTRMKEVEKISFTELFASAADKDEVVCTFLALLELIRLRQVRAVQESVYGEITLHRGDEMR